MAEVTWSTACPDWQRRIVAGESLVPFDPLFPGEAAEALELFGSLRIVDAAGSPTMAEVARPWVNDFVGAIFGAYDPDTGRRLVNEFLLLISKKNGKSTIAAGIMLTALVLNWRKSGEFIILAPTKEIADNSYKPISDMIKADEGLSALLQVQDHYRLVTHYETGATLKVVAADSDTVSGKKAIGVFVDELHEFGKKARASNMLLEATGGLTSRPEGFVIYATTQSEDPPAGVFRQKLKYARNVRDGVIVNPRFLPVLYEFPEAMVKAKAYQDLANAHVTNPNWGLSVDVQRIEQLYEQHMQDGEAGFREFAAKHLNVEIGMALQSDRWVGADFWEAAADKDLAALPADARLKALLARCEVAVVGVDGGGLDDLLGLAVLGRERGTRRWLHWGRAWAHRIALDRRSEIAPRLQDMHKAGELMIVDRPGDDVDEVVQIICQVRDAKLLPDEHGIAVDSSGIADILTALTAPEIGFRVDQITAVRQGYTLNGVIKSTERKLAGGDLLHCGQELMTWSVGNARIEDKGNAILVTKQASGKAKIDPVMALFDAVTMLALEPAPKASFDDYLKHGFFDLVG